eukprot:1373322-Prymnesium_polylepis.1
MHSTYLFDGQDFSASKCADGVTNNTNGFNFCMTTISDDPWVSVGIPSGSSVSEFWVYTRHDDYQYLLSPFEIWLADAPGPPSLAPSAVQCGSTMSVPATAGPHVVSCGPPQQAAYATLLLPGSSRVVMLAEIM